MSVKEPCQHLLMDGDAESLERYLERVVVRLIERLLEDPRIPAWGVLGELAPATTEWYDQLSRIKMAAQVRKALDKHLGDLIVHGDEPRIALLDQVLKDEQVKRATWREIGDALGVSAQAAHRKYGHLVRHTVPDAPPVLTADGAPSQARATSASG